MKKMDAIKENPNGDNIEDENEDVSDLGKQIKKFKS